MPRKMIAPFLTYIYGSDHSVLACNTYTHIQIQADIKERCYPLFISFDRDLGDTAYLSWNKRG
jgi:hypothetical protein